MKKHKITISQVKLLSQPCRRNILDKRNEIENGVNIK